MMPMAEQSADGPGFRVVAPKCPLFPKTVPVVHGIQLYPFATRSFLEGRVNPPASLAQAENQYRASSPRAHQTRGPPQFSSPN